MTNLKLARKTFIIHFHEQTNYEHKILTIFTLIHINKQFLLLFMQITTQHRLN